MTVELRLGDCIEVMKSMPEYSLDSIVTDPPYELGFMGKAWDKSGISYNVETWKEALRILKPGAYLLAFGGSRTYHRIACAIEDAGFEIRDQIQWVYGSGFPKSHKEENGQGTALKPAHEPIVMARKPLSEKTVAENIKRWGTGAINIDTCRVPGEPTPINKLAKWSGFGQLEKPDYSQEINNSGRFPSNLIHDGSDEVIEMFPQTNSGSLLKHHKRTGGKSPIGTFEIRNRTGESEFLGDFGSAARFYYCAKASKEDRNAGLCGVDKQITDDGRNKSIDNAFLRGETLRRNPHPTVKPTELMRYLCRLVTPTGGTIGDFFMGSGSTGRGAVLEGFNFIGGDKDPENIPLAEMRINAAKQQMRLEFPA